ncbi:GntR family transcriptional regulator [Nosocomiicoccus ampullae]|uniref:GntR family transcriptional regulator n=1 Tax=Nosocomiicoccus ampullae TaxID=489910 RepID=UPI001C60490E|nr:GntR family transcriptional regulator [Nosocomiicoccus ampullae]QYA49103.1 GntR family transcriptional regulator [Nosocomiicoccus ampullae]
MNITERIYLDLLNKIHNGYYKEGDILPTEKELIDNFKVSRSPVRSALNRLKDEGYIDRKPRIGSEVISCERVIEKSSFKGGFSKYFGLQDNNIKTKTIEVSKIINNLDNVFTHEKQLTKISRIRTVNDIPVFFIRTYYPSHYFKESDIEEFENINNLREWIQNKVNVKFVYSNEKIFSVNSNSLLSNILNIENNTALLKINRYTFNYKYELVEYVEYYVNTNVWHYEVDYEF